MAVNVPVPSEETEQVMLFRWASYVSGGTPELRMLFAIPNGGYRMKATAARMKATGTRAGVPDMMLAVPRGKYHGLFIELKRRQGGVVSVAQKAWMAELEKQGYKCVVCRGWEEASKAITIYLKD